MITNSALVSPFDHGLLDITQEMPPLITAAALAYKSLGKVENLKAVYPDAGHDFPEEGRKCGLRVPRQAPETVSLSPCPDPRDFDHPGSGAPSAFPSGFRAAVTSELAGLGYAVVGWEPDGVNVIAPDRDGEQYIGLENLHRRAKAAEGPG